MSYTYDNIQLDCIDNSGTVLYNIATFTAATIPAVPVEGLAIGIKVRLTFTINSSGANSFLNKQLRFNPGLYVLSNQTNAFDFGYQTLNPLSTTPQQAVLNVAIPTLQNIYCEMSKNAPPHDVATVLFEFYVTNDTTNFIFGNSSNSNVNRFLASSSLGLPNNIGQIVYNQTKNLSLGCRIFDSTGFSANATTPVGGNFVNILVNARWYNSDYLGYSLLMRYIRELEITSASQTAASLPLLTEAKATAAQPNTSTIPNAIFTVTNNQLAVGEDNSVRILLRGEAYNGSVNNPAISDIRVLFFRVDTVLNNTDFVTDLQLSDAVIPSSQPVAGQLDGAIFSPSDWFEDVPNPDDIEVQFVIDGSQLQINGQYYIVVNIHDAANPEYVTSHLSPLLTATYTAPAIPTLTGFISTYNTEYSGNELTIAPHQRIKARLDIDKLSYQTALNAIGLTGTFDGSVAGIICRLTNVPGVVNQVQGYIPANPPITTADMVIVNETVNDLVLDCIFRIAEEYAGTSTEITWTISLNQPTTTNGITQFTQINYVQKLDVDVFENDAISPNLLSIKFYDLADYIVGIKTEILDICDADQIIAEVEKDPTFTGSINFIATIYPANELGDTNNNAIEEESSWQPIVVQMQQLVSGKLDDVDASFGVNDLAIFKINVQQLTQGQRYWVTGIAYQQIPDYCPIGLVALTSTSTYRTVGVLPLWTITGNPTAVIAEILAHPDYVGGINVVQNNFVDNANSPVGVLSYAGNVVTAIKISDTIPIAYYRFIVDADFDPGTGPHTIRHEILMPVPIPAPSLIPIVTFDNTYKCSDLG
jgi:hypothetical protein